MGFTLVSYLKLCFLVQALGLVLTQPLLDEQELMAMIH